MDSGYIFSGWTGWWQWPDDDLNTSVAEVDTGCTQDAWLVRYSEEGEYLWGIEEERGVDYHYYSCLQLSEGGYIACGTWGGSGYMVRYAPETGIEVEESSSVIVLDISPNPFSSSLSISCEIPEPTQIELSIFDLSGRLIENLISSSVTSGVQNTVWNPGASIPDGCYMARLSTLRGSTSVMCVYLK